MNGFARLPCQACRFMEAPLPAACRAEERRGLGLQRESRAAKRPFLPERGEGKVEDLAVDGLQLADQHVDDTQARRIPSFKCGCCCLDDGVSQGPFVHA